MSSRTKSSSRSSSKRGKKQKPYTKKSVTRHGINFFAMFFGMVSGLMAILLVYNAFSTPPLNKEFLNANAANIGTVAATIDKKDFDYIVENSDTQKLTEILTGLAGIKSFSNIQSQITHCKRSVAVSDRMLDATLTKPQRKLAIGSKLAAASRMFWLVKKNNLGEADVSSTLRDTAKQYSDDADPEISFLARSELLRLNSLDAAENIASHGIELRKFIEDFPEDPRAHFQIFASLRRQLASPKNRHLAIKLANQVLASPRVQGNKSTEEFYSRISDLWNLCDRNFFEIFENRKIGGSEPIEQLHHVCLELLKIPTAGREILSQVASSAKWLETTNKYAQAQDLYRAITKLDFNKEMNQKAAFGNARCEAIGKHFVLNGTKIDDSPLDETQLNNMPVILIYWTDGDPKSAKTLIDVEAVLAKWRPDSIKIVAPWVGKPKNFNFETVSTAAKAHSKWTFCKPDANGSYPLFNLLPSLDFPRIALLDRNHNVVDVDIPVDELLTEIKSVFARSRTKK